MTIFTSIGSTALPNVWRSLKRLSKQRLGYVPMRARHLARAQHLYEGYLDYDGALAELRNCSQSLPNDARLFALKGYIERHRPGGNQEEALRIISSAQLSSTHATASCCGSVVL